MNRSFGRFMLLWTGDLISQIGSGLTAFGLGVYVYEKTGSASLMALITLCGFLPSLLLGVPAGVLADRYDRRLLMVLGDSLSALGLVFILFFLLRGEAEVWHIMVGVTISSVFASLLGPAYRATITDLMTSDQYARAGGLMQVASSAKYLISPALAGFLLTLSDVKLLIYIDIATFFITVLSTLVVRKGLGARGARADRPAFRRELAEGWRAVAGNRGVLALVVMSAGMTFSLGFIQTLSQPMVLAFAGSAQLGIMTTVAASGMLVTSLLLGIRPMKKRFVTWLWASLFVAGLSMMAFGLWENIVFVGATGFCFFAALPGAETGLDVLIRSHIDNALQGRAWGLIGMITQLGYVAAYALSGALADWVFTPLLSEGGALSASVGRVIGVGPGRGVALMIVLAGLLLCAMAFWLSRVRSVRALEPKTPS